MLHWINSKFSSSTAGWFKIFSFMIFDLIVIWKWPGFPGRMTICNGNKQPGIEPRFQKPVRSWSHWQPWTRRSSIANAIFRIWLICTTRKIQRIPNRKPMIPIHWIGVRLRKQIRFQLIGSGWWFLKCWSLSCSCVWFDRSKINKSINSPNVFDIFF